MAPKNASLRLATVGLVALVALDVVLVGVALRTNDASSADTSLMDGATGSKAAGDAASHPVGRASTSSASPSTTATGTGTATSITGLAAPLQTTLVALDDKRAWRASAGSCSAGGAALAITSDGGKTWVDVKAPLKSIARVRPSDGQTAFVVGADATCVAELTSTTDGGATWRPTGDVGGAWFRDPKDPTVVGAPGASTSQPCTEPAVLDLAVLSPTAARVLCADGRVRATADTGSSWTDTGQVPGAVALAVLSTSPAQTYVARLGALECTGIQIQRVDQSVATSCVQTALPNDPGQIALSLVKGGGWLAIGDMTMRSTDALVTWSVS